MKGQVWRNLPNFVWVWLVWCPPVCTPAEFRSGEVVDVGCDVKATETVGMGRAVVSLPSVHSAL